MSNSAQEILRQLNPNRLKAMIGANNFFSSNEGRTLGFRFKGSKVSNHVTITHNAMDTYDVEFKKIWGTNIKTTGESNGIYNDQLKSVIEDHTGLYLTL